MERAAQALSGYRPGGVCRGEYLDAHQYDAQNPKPCVNWLPTAPTDAVLAADHGASFNAANEVYAETNARMPPSEGLRLDDGLRKEEVLWFR